MIDKTRGESNCNPGNLERNGTKWKGMCEQQTDARFVSFQTPQYGIRALATVLLTYYRQHNLKTISGIVKRFAPPTENDTQSYIMAVSQEVGVKPDEIINVSNRDTLEKLVTAIIRHENGRVPYSPDIIRAGIDLA
jgi:hypothetical protein